MAQQQSGGDVFQAFPLLHQQDLQSEERYHSFRSALDALCWIHMLAKCQKFFSFQWEIDENLLHRWPRTSQTERSVKLQDSWTHVHLHACLSHISENEGIKLKAKAFLCLHVVLRYCAQSPTHLLPWCLQQLFCPPPPLELLRVYEAQ